MAIPVLAAACSSTSPTAANVRNHTAGSSYTVGDIDNPAFGDILVTSAGMALYTYAADGGHNGMSTCTGSCSDIWPALTVHAGATPTRGPGVTGTLAAVRQANGTYQVTYDGLPLYRFARDTAAGQVTGNGVGGFTVAENVGAPPGSTIPTTPTTATPAPPTTSARSTAPPAVPAPTAPPSTAPPPTAPPTTAPPPTTQPPATTSPPATTTTTYYQY